MALSELRGRLKALRNVKLVELVKIPVLVTCVFSSAFKCVGDVKMENASLLEEIEELKEVVERKKAVISCKRDWDCVDKRVVELIEVSNGCCNEEGLKELDLSGFVNLRELMVGDECFENVKKVNICGLKELEKMIVGSKSFTKEKDVWLYEKDGCFNLKNCPKLKELRVTGVRSFSDYSVCEIENVDALEVIEMGDLKDWSVNFYYASLELKSIHIHRE